MKTLSCAALLLAACAFARAADGDARPAHAPEPVVQRTVTEGRDVRIEELRVRGETKSIVVKSRLPALPFEYGVLPSSAARDPSQGGGDNTGQAFWHLFSY